jgi:hypothetical protein
MVLFVKPASAPTMRHVRPAPTTPIVRRHGDLPGFATVSLPPNSRESPIKETPKAIAYRHFDHMIFANVTLPPDSRDLAEMKGRCDVVPPPVSPVPFAGFPTSPEHSSLAQEKSLPPDNRESPIQETPKTIASQFMWIIYKRRLRVYTGWVSFSNPPTPSRRTLSSCW